MEKLTSENEILKEKHRALEEAMKLQEAQRDQYSKSMEAQVKSFNETIGKMTMMMQTMMVQQQKVPQVIFNTKVLNEILTKNYSGPGTSLSSPPSPSTPPCYASRSPGITLALLKHAHFGATSSATTSTNV